MTTSPNQRYEIEGKDKVGAHTSRAGLYCGQRLRGGLSLLKEIGTKPRRGTIAVTKEYP